MFHSNQIFDVTCESGDLELVLDFAVRLFNENADMFTRPDGRVSMAFSEPVPGVYGREGLDRLPVRLRPRDYREDRRPMAGGEPARSRQAARHRRERPSRVPGQVSPQHGGRASLSPRTGRLGLDGRDPAPHALLAQIR